VSDNVSKIERREADDKIHRYKWCDVSSYDWSRGIENIIVRITGWKLRITLKSVIYYLLLVSKGWCEKIN